jgi:hypothetical protein
MANVWKSLRTALIFAASYVLTQDLWRGIDYHRAPTWAELPDDLIRALTVAIFYFATDWLYKRFKNRKLRHDSQS